MRIWKPTMHSIYGLLGGAASRGGHLPSVSTAQIQDAMVAAMRAAGVDLKGTLALRIDAAPDLQALWYLRIELMTVLAAAQGEARAGSALEMISGLFDGLLPRGLSMRPRRLVG